MHPRTESSAAIAPSSSVHPSHEAPRGRSARFARPLAGPWSCALAPALAVVVLTCALVPAGTVRAAQSTDAPPAAAESDRAAPPAGDIAPPVNAIARARAAGADADADGEAQPGPPRIRFNFKGATFEQVVDFFARATGLPVVWETDPPAGTLDYLSPESYAPDEALRILNIILQGRGVSLRRTGDMLYLQPLDRIRREDVPTFVGQVPADIGDEEIVTVVRPLEIATANSLAERLAEMVAEYGAVTALPQQNALIITETAAQVRRLIGIIEELDRQDPEGAIEIIPVRNAKAADLMPALNALLSQRVQKFVVDSKGKQIKVDEDTMEGLNITVDERTNAIVAKGVQSRIDQLEDVVALLDVPATNARRTIRSFRLARLAPSQARTNVQQIFQTIPAPQRPTILVDDAEQRLTIVGDEAAVNEVRELLRDIDGLAGEDLIAGSAMSPEGRAMSVVPVEQAEADAVLQALRGLLSRRQEAVVKLLAGPDGRSIVLSGPAGDVAAVEALVPALDRPRRGDRTVRILALESDAPVAAVERARTLFAERQGGMLPDDLSIELEADEGTLVLVGASRDLDAFAEVLRTVEQGLVLARETRQVALENARPSQVAAELGRMLRAAPGLVRPEDGEPVKAPTLVPVDALGLLQVSARPADLGFVLSLVGALDRPTPETRAVRLVDVAGVSDVGALLERAGRLWNARTEGLEDDLALAPDVTFDAAAGTVVLAGDSDAVRRYEQTLGEARRLLPPPREGRLLQVRQADAAQVLAQVRELYATVADDPAGRDVPAPDLELVERTNAIFVRAEPAQLRSIERLVRDLDVLDTGDLPPLRLLQVRTAEAASVAEMLSKRFDARPADDRRARPVQIDVDAATNSLVVTAHEDVYAEIQAFVEEVNQSRADAADRRTMIFPLRRARATDLARALEQLYPEPPVPVDRRGRPMPQLRQPREVYVSADPATNTLIIEAPAEREASFEALVARLDRVELPPRAELRTYRIERGDPNLVARTLEQLARRGILSEQPEDGSKPVEVVVSAEPVSRTLIVTGDRVTFEQVEAILADLEMVPVERQLRVFTFGGGNLDRLAEQAERLYAEQTADVPAAGSVSVEIDREAGALLVVAEPDAMVRFAAILDQLERVAGPAPEVRLIALEHADAAETVGFLEELAASRIVGENAGADDGSMPTREGAADAVFAVPPRFEAIERTNSILVAARPEQLDIIQSIVRSLDRLEPTDMPPLRILRLRTAEAAGLASALQRQYDQRPGDQRTEKPVRITADGVANALLVAAHPDLLPEIEEVVEDLNRTDPRGADGREIRIFPLRVARAEQLARTLDEMFPAPPPPLDRRGRPMPQLQAPPEVVVRADEQTNAIIVDAPAARMAGFETLVEQLDRQEIGPDTAIRTYEVTYADPAAVERTLQELVRSGALSGGQGDRRTPISVVREPATGRLIVSGPTSIFDRVEQVLADVDVAASGPASEVRFYRLEFARADRLAEVLRGVLVARANETLPLAGRDASGLVEVTADRATNTVILSAPSDLLPLADDIVSQLDDAEASIGEPAVRVRVLDFADAAEVARALATAAQNLVSPVTGEPTEARIVAAPSSNALVMSGPAEDLDAIDALVGPLDARPARDAIDALSIRLEHATASEVGPVLERLLVDRFATDPRIVFERLRRSRGDFDPEATIRVEADARTNSIIVSGPRTAVALAESLASTLDRPATEGDHEVALYAPERIDAQRLVDGVERLLDLANGGAASRRVALAVDPASRSVIVAGPKDRVEDALARLEAAEAAAPVMPRVTMRALKLERSEANAIARAIGPMLRDRARWPADLRRAVEAGLAVAEPVVTPDDASGRVIVSGPDALVDIAAGLVRELDGSGTAAAAGEVRLVVLERAEAARVAQAVQATMEARARRVPGEQAPVITAIDGANAIVATGTPAQLDTLEEIARRLDGGATQGAARVATVVLEHARAEEVVPIVERLLASEQVPLWMRFDAARRNQDVPAPGPDVRVAADPRLNAVVIAAPAGALDAAVMMVEQLDVDPDSDPATRRRVHVVEVRNADASAIAATLEGLFDVETGSAPAPVIRVDAASNSLVLRATQAQYDQVVDTVRRLDAQATLTARQLRVLPVDPSRASADDIARALRGLLDRGGTGRVEVVPLETLLERTRGTGSEDDAAPDGGVGLALPPGLGGDLAVRTAAALALPLALPDVTTTVRAAAAAQTQAAARAPTPPASGNEGADVSIAVDPATNSLVIVGAPAAVERIERLARELEQELPAAPTRLRYVPLPTDVDAQRLRQLVEATLARMTPAGGRPGDLRRRVAVVPDVEGGGIIIAASDADFETVGDLVAALARPAAADDLLVKVYALETVTAERVRQSLEAIVTGRQPGRRGRGRQADRMREVALTLLGGEERVRATFDPERVRIVADAGSNRVVVTAPPEAIPVLDRFVELLDQAPASEQSTLKLYPLRHARAGDIEGTIRRVMRSRSRSLERATGTRSIDPEFAVDERTNALLVTASPEAFAEIDDLVATLDRDLGEQMAELEIVELASARPSRAAELIRDTILDVDQERRARTLVVADDASGLLLLRADEATRAEIDRVLARVDRDPADDLPVRTIVLERADAESVAEAVQRFFDDRARITSSGRGRNERGRQVSVVGNSMSKTLLVAASDEDFAQIEDLVERFDSPQATDAWTYRVIPVTNARATDLAQSVNQLIDNLTWGQGPFFFGFGGGRGGRGAGQSRGTIAVQADARLNALIVTGEGDKFDLVEQLVSVLDAPADDAVGRTVRVYRVENADLDIVEDAVEGLYGNPDRPWWQDADPLEVRISRNDRLRSLVVLATEREHEGIGELVAGIDADLAGPDRLVDIVAIEYAQPDEVADVIENFLEARARAEGRRDADVVVQAAEASGALLVSGEADAIDEVRRLVSRIDQPDVSGERTIEILPVNVADVAEVGRIVREQLGTDGRRGERGVRITVDERTSALVVSAAPRELALVESLVERLDVRAADEDLRFRTIALEQARTDQVVEVLTAVLGLDGDGRTDGTAVRLDGAEAAVEVVARVTADERANAIVVAATEDSLPVIEALVARLDQAPAAAPVEYRIIALEHALAEDVAFTLGRVGDWGDGPGPRPSFDWNRGENRLIVSATPDQFEQIDRLVSELDQPPVRTRVTEFVPLEFAEAQKVQEALSVFYGPTALEADTPSKLNVRIVADPATNSLVITAAEREWPNVRALLSELDSEEYDASLQLAVIPLLHADAASVASAINEAFEGRVGGNARGRNQRNRGNDNARRGEDESDGRDSNERPDVLVAADEWVRAAAEPLTNSLVVSASRRNLDRIRGIVGEIDQADFSELPPPRLIAVTSGTPEQLARALQAAAAREDGSSRGLRIVADAPSRTVIVRADDAEFERLSSLARDLQREADGRRAVVEVVTLASSSATRVAEALNDAYRVRAQSEQLPLSIRAEAGDRALVVTAPPALLEEIRGTAAALDEIGPSAGQGVFIIELSNVTPGEAERTIRAIGLDRPQADASARIVSEPVRIAALPGRNAIVVTGSPADRDTITRILQAIDAAPAEAGETMRLVRLANAEAGAAAELLRRILDPAAEGGTGSRIAAAAREQIRRLTLRRNGATTPDLDLDLAVPIRIVPAPAVNGLLVSSTPTNVEAVIELAQLLDDVPLTDAATVQLFPLESIDADAFLRVVRDLFQQGKALGSVPGSSREGVPAGMVGRALASEIALASDPRTNTVIAAGSEDAVALVEVMVKRLDDDVTAGWVEPKLLPLKHADATELAATLESILVEGASDAPGAAALQRQVGRLRMLRSRDRDDQGDGPRNGPGPRNGAVLESEVFRPLRTLVIRPEAQLNALLLVGSPPNLEVVAELVAMLDVPAAAPDATVRLYPVENASAARVASTLTRLFEQQVRTRALRPEDAVFAEADERTNSIVVSTSPRSFAVLEGLLAMLDADIAPDLREIRRIELENASASRLAPLIQEMMDARLDRLRTVQPETADLEQATITADARTNSLIVAAGNESFEVIRLLAAELDGTTLGANGLVEVISLESGNADRIAETVNEVMERRYADLPADVRASQRPLVLTDSRSNSLLVAASREDVAVITDLVARLERAPSDPAVALHVLPLPPSAGATELAPRLQRLMRERQQALGDGRRPSDQVAIEADAGGRALVVAASRENLEVIEGLVELLVDAGTQADAQRRVDVIPLASGQAADVVDLVEELYVGPERRVRGDEAVSVTADDRINAIVVRGSENDVAEVRALVARLDDERPATVVEIRNIPLSSANALETVGLLETVLSGQGIGGRRGRERAVVLKYLPELAEGAEPGDVRDAASMLDEGLEVSSALREAVSLTPDIRTNSVIVRAPRDAMALLEQMIEDLDASSEGSKSIRIFKLQNADAIAMAEILTDLFAIGRGDDLLVLRPREGGFGGAVPGMAPGAGGLDGGLAPGIAPGGAFAGGIGGTELTAVPDERQQLSITVDSRTNSLLVSGSPTYLDLVSEVVDELDALEANERETFVYRLRNASADQVAQVLSDFVAEEQQKLISTLDADQIGSAARLLEREVTIQGDVQSNTVLVSASPRYVERVESLIRQLDVDPPQVLIQVMLAEVTLDSADDWGVDFNAAGRADSVDIAGGFGLASSFVTGMGTPSLTLTGNDFELFINAIQEQGRLQVLSSPHVMAANNEPALIQVGETIRVPETTSFTDGGNTNTSTVEKELGTILRVTPSINPDGFVRMTVQPEISNLSQRTTQINEDLESPIITIRRAETTVTVKDGQTIVLGGLISDRFERRIRKVPGFGDLPLIGALFRAETEETRKTELLIVLTPHVIESPAAFGRTGEITDREIERLTLPPGVRERIRRGITNGPGLNDGKGMYDWLPGATDEGAGLDPDRDR